MRLLYKNVDDRNMLSVVEVLSADAVTNMELLINEDGYDEIPDLPGIHFTCAAIEPLPAGECYYDTIIMVCADMQTVQTIIHDIAIDGYLDSTKYKSHCLLNAEPQGIYDLLKASADEWGAKNS